MKGKIVKGIAGFYYVDVGEAGIYECKAKGIFRKQNIKPLVGDDVEISITDENDHEGNIDEILKRENTLLRPAVANVDQVLIVFAIKDPDVNYHLLNRYLVWMEDKDIPINICFNKCELASDEEIRAAEEAFKNTGYNIMFASVKNDTGLEEVRAVLKDRTTALSGPSGVGKSSIINAAAGKNLMETGEISKKISRGKHTTRHSELFKVGEDTYVFDTPGFSSMELTKVEKEELYLLFPEMAKYENECRFTGCSHISEPDCAIKEACERGEISDVRYEDYKLFYEELKNEKKY